jgi:FkbM family methyltransferase
LERWTRFLDLPRHREVTVELAGRPFRVPDPLSFYWSYKEIVEDRIYDFPFPAGSPRILDLGANCGLSGLFFLLRYPEARLTCVEADPALFAILRDNLRTADFERRTRFVSAAVSPIAGEVEFHASGADSGRLIPHETLPSRTRRVTAVSLDSLIERPVDFLKMDIEGAETDVLLAAGKLDAVARVFVEYHSLTDRPQRLDELLAHLRQVGFRTWIQTQYCPPLPFHEIRPQADMDLQLNLFAERKN